MHSSTLRSPTLAAPHHDFGAGLWRLADPKISIASLVPFCVGTTIAWRAGGGHVDLAIAAAAMLAIFCVEVGKNAVNDLFDFRSGADLGVRDDERSPYSGGKRVLVDALLSENDLVLIGWVAFLASAIIGTAIALSVAPGLLILGAAAAAASVAYSFPPLQLSYRGFGEMAVFAVYGPGVVLGSIMLQGAPITSTAIIDSVVLGLLIATVLVLNEFPDERADRAAGKNTLVVRLGADRARGLVSSLFMAAFAIPVFWALYIGPMRLCAAFIGAPVAIFAWQKLNEPRTGPPVVAQTAALATFVITGAGIIAAEFLA